MPSHESKLQICQSWYQKMRRLILRRTDELPGSPDSRIQKFTRGLICGLKRPRPFISVLEMHILI